ncbi:MAG: type III polyketide synthase [Chlamydiales bacterium]
MKTYCYSIATSVPRYILSQENAKKKILELFPFEPENRIILEKIYDHSGIQKRHVITRDFLNEEPVFLGCKLSEELPGMSRRNEVYKRESPLLACEAAKEALEKWGGDPSKITHVISVSCTGVVIPGIEFEIMHRLGLNRSVGRFGINFMGCFGAFKGLEIGHAFARANPQNRILVVCTELCSLHIQTTMERDSLLANSLFADGAAAVVLGSSPEVEEQPLCEIVQHTSSGLTDSHELMTWEASDDGFVMKLSGHVPLKITRHITPFVERLMKQYTNTQNSNWAIHPGGKAILRTLEKKLGLEYSQTQASWETLKQYGNMSSATFLFVLESLCRQKKKAEWTVGLGFGPGLSVEGVLLRHLN